MIQAFGWDMLLAAAADQERFDKVLESFFQLSLHYFTGAGEDVHRGLPLPRRHGLDPGRVHAPGLLPLRHLPALQEALEVLHEAGKIVLFCSDGDFTEFVDDIAEAGADGFIFEPMTDLDYVVEHYGKTHCIISSKVDCRTLTFGTPEQIKARDRRDAEDRADLPRVHLRGRQPHPEQRAGG